MRYKQGDTFPLEIELKWSDGSVVNLTEVDTVDFIMTAWGESTPTVEGECVIVTADEGLVRYDWEDGETDDAGMYKVEFKITYNDADVYTVPTGSELFLLIEDELAS